jgi:hypothetical protein
MSEELVRRRLFREVNERIRSVNLRFGTAADEMHVLCECGRRDCIDRIEIPISVFDEISLADDLFLVAHGHAQQPEERLVAEAGEYDVIAVATAAAL